MFFTVITNHANIGPEKWLEASYKEMLAIMCEILRALNRLIIHMATIAFLACETLLRVQRLIIVFTREFKTILS